MPKGVIVTRTVAWNAKKPYTTSPEGERARRVARRRSEAAETGTGMARSSWDNSEGHVEWEGEGQRGTEGKGAGPETWVAIVLTCAEDGRGAGEMTRSTGTLRQY